MIKKRLKVSTTLELMQALWGGAEYSRATYVRTVRTYVCVCTDVRTRLYGRRTDSAGDRCGGNTSPLD